MAVGVSTPRRDSGPKVRGATRFAADIAVPGLLHARLVLSHEAHASVATSGVGDEEELSDNVLDTARLENGDVDAALAASHVVVKGRLRTPWMYQGYIEPQTATAWVDPEGQLVVSSSTQAPF